MPGDTVAFGPPLIIGDAEIDEMMAGFGKALDDTSAMRSRRVWREANGTAVHAVRLRNPDCRVPVMPRQYLVEIFLPLLDPNGKRFPERRHRAVREELVEQFGGVTAHLRAPAVGLWKPTHRSPTERDLIIIYEVMTRTLDRPWWSNYRKQLEKDFRQRELVIRAHRIRLL